LIQWAALCFISAMVAGYSSFPGVARDSAYERKILAVVGPVLARLSFLVHCGRQAWSINKARDRSLQANRAPRCPMGARVP